MVLSNVSPVAFQIFCRVSSFFPPCSAVFLTLVATLIVGFYLAFTWALLCVKYAVLNNIEIPCFQAEVLQEDQRMPRKGQGREGRRSAAMNAWSGVERNLRAALRRNPASPLVQELEV